MEILFILVMIIDYSGVMVVTTMVVMVIIVIPLVMMTPMTTMMGLMVEYRFCYNIEL